jgi:pimeloyl-ACP methyl ester carboxylesterase
MPALADRWRLLAPDFPGCGYSDTPAHFRYDFDGYARFLDRFVGELGVRRYALYLHDFGSQIGLRLAMQAPERVAGVIIQNGDTCATRPIMQSATAHRRFASRRTAERR